MHSCQSSDGQSVAALVAIVIFFSAVIAQPIVKLGRIEPQEYKDYYPEISANRTIELQRNITKFELVCCDSYPIQWTYTGDESPHRINVTAFRNHSDVQTGFQVTLNFERVSSAITGNYSCNRIESNSPELMAKTWVYIYGQNPAWMAQYEFKLLLHGRTENIQIEPDQNITHFPCSVSDPRTIVALKRKFQNKRGYETIHRNQYLIYAPSTGFMFHRLHPQFTPGIYFCSTSDSDVVTIYLSEKEVDVDPKSTQIEVIIGPSHRNQLKTTCYSINPVSMLITGTDSGDGREISTVSGLNSNASSPFRYKASLDFTNLTMGDVGVVKCVEKPSQSLGTTIGDVLHSWSYQTLPEFLLSKIGWGNYTMVVNGQLRIFRYCWAQTTNSPLVRFVRCVNEMECDIKRRCVEMGSVLCDNTEFRICPGGCGRGEQLRTSGFYHCQGDGLDVLGNDGKISWNVFGVSHLYDMSKHAYTRRQLFSPEYRWDVMAIQFADFKPTNATIQLLKGDIYNFTCLASSFLFAKGLEWEVTYDQGLPYSLHTGMNRHDGIAEMMSHREYMIEEGFVTIKSSIRINSTKVTSIKCIGYLWNPLMFGSPPMDSWSTSVDLDVGPTDPPQFVSGSFKRNFSYDINDEEESTERTIICPVTGTPYPKITWLKDGKPLPYGVQPNGNKLTFRFVNQSHAGKYTCTATNFRGSLSTDFYVKTFTSTPNRSRWVVAFGVPAIILMIVLLGIIALFWRKIRHQRKLIRNLTADEIKEFEHGNPDSFDPDADISDQAHLLAYNSTYEFPKDKLTFSLKDKLGSGEYGLVLKGYATNIYPTELETIVAVKTIKASADVMQFKSLLAELKIMSRIGRHPHLVNLLGACTKEIAKREVFIIVEYCANGDLKSFLRKQRALINIAFDSPTGTQRCVGRTELLNWSYQIASGMNYLANQKVIHGDLAARNILLTDTLLAKIGDFGMSRRLYAKNYVKKNKQALPWKWMAIESLQDMEFSTKSDVWSYGITLWEIFSLGGTPYPGISWTSDFMRQLVSGYRLQNPQYASDSVFALMSSCWAYNPDFRPAFDAIMAQLTDIMQQYSVALVESPTLTRRTAPYENIAFEESMEPCVYSSIRVF